MFYSTKTLYRSSCITFTFSSLQNFTDKDENYDKTPAPKDDFVPRSYQEQLLEHVLAKNAIIYLPTGAGKTFIAMMAIKSMAKPLALPLAGGGKRSVFLANTVALAHQQSEWLRQHTSLRVSVYTGDMNVDAWKRERWGDEFNDNQVLVATAQIILDVIQHGYISIRQLNVIVFDECHHARGNHVMHRLMQAYHVERQRIGVLASRQNGTEYLPRIIGLTGVLVDGAVKRSTLLTTLNQLESTYHGTIVTVSSAKEFVNVLTFSTNPVESVITYTADHNAKSFLTMKVKGIIERMCLQVDQWPVDPTNQTASMSHTLKGERVKLVKKLISLLKDFLYQMEDLGIYGAGIGILSVLVELELKKRSVDTKLKRQIIRNLITKAELIRHLIAEELNGGVEETDDSAEDASEILTNCSPKVQKFLLYLRQFFLTSTAEANALIFVDRRHSAKCLFHVIKRYVSAANLPIRADFMVGNNSAMPDSIEAILDNKWNRECVQRFRRKELNLIVATTVLEEGIDLQMCNLVISFDAPKSYRSYAQSKGRARVATSKYVIMIVNTKGNELSAQLTEYELIDRMLKDYLIGKSIDRSVPSEGLISAEFANRYIQPFRTKGGAVLDGVSSCPLLNRYCMSLPTDTFSRTTVIWTLVTGNAGGKEFVVKMRMPMQSNIKADIIVSAWMKLKCNLFYIKNHRIRLEILCHLFKIENIYFFN